MREIKFRAWDGEKMIKESKRGEYDDYYTMDLDGSFYAHTRTGDEWFDDDKDEMNQKTYTLLQYTGLKDKNDKEIYEGDIVKEVYVPLNSYPDIIQYYKEGIIVWNYKGFGVLLKIEGAKILDESRKLSYHKTVRKVYSHPTQGENWVDNNVSFNRLEIIGNIYENPELIEPCKD